MIIVVSIVALLIVLRGVTTVWIIDDWYRWWRAPEPTTLPRSLPAAVSSPAPIGNPANWFSSDDYPKAALRAGAQGAVSVELLIGSDGRAEACEITRSSGSVLLDRATCRLAVRHGRFLPAKDADGQAVEGRYTLPRVIWRLTS